MVYNVDQIKSKVLIIVSKYGIFIPIGTQESLEALSRFILNKIKKYSYYRVINMQPALTTYFIEVGGTPLKCAKVHIQVTTAGPATGFL